MTRVRCYAVRVLAVVVLGLPARAAPPSDEPLEPEQAFPVDARVRAEGIDLAFRIADGYYLYGSRFRVEAERGLPVGPPQLPRGEPKDDPFIGRTEILRRAATIHLPFTGGARPGTYVLKVTAQGCAEDRVCYAPFTQVIRVTLPGAQ